MFPDEQLLSPDVFGDALVRIGLVQLRDGTRWVTPSPERLERFLQLKELYWAMLRRKPVRAELVQFQINWPLVAICGACGAHYCVSRPDGVEKAKQHQDNLKHQPWTTEFRKPWKVGPDTVIEQAGEVSR